MTLRHQHHSSWDQQPSRDRQPFQCLGICNTFIVGSEHETLGWFIRININIRIGNTLIVTFSNTYNICLGHQDIGITQSGSTAPKTGSATPSMWGSATFPMARDQQYLYRRVGTQDIDAIQVGLNNTEAGIGECQLFQLDICKIWSSIGRPDQIFWPNVFRYDIYMATTLIYFNPQFSKRAPCSIAKLFPHRLLLRSINPMS